MVRQIWTTAQRKHDEDHDDNLRQQDNRRDKSDARTVKHPQGSFKDLAWPTRNFPDITYPV